MAATTAAQPALGGELPGGLAGFGFSERDSVLIYRAFSTFLLGHLLLESATVDSMAESVDEDIEFFESNRSRIYPRLQALGPRAVRGWVRQ